MMFQCLWQHLQNLWLYQQWEAEPQVQQLLQLEHRLNVKTYNYQHFYVIDQQQISCAILGWLIHLENALKTANTTGFFFWVRVAC